jgi:hypothetical protein
MSDVKRFTEAASGPEAVFAWAEAQPRFFESTHFFPPSPIDLRPARS